MFTKFTSISFWSRILLCCCLVFLPNFLWAQTDECAAEFDFDVQVTPSTCQSNGTVKVTLKGDYNNFHEFHYSVPSAVAGAKVIPPQREDLLEGLPAGRHRVRVDAICKGNKNRTQFAEKEIVVPGNYEVIQVVYNRTKSLKSYAECPSGTMVFDVRGGKPSEYVFTIVQAPTEAGLTLPAVLPHTLNGESYALSGTYPPGDYKISVKDACYEFMLEFSIPTWDDFPVPSHLGNSQFYPYTSPAGYDCITIRNTGLSNSNSQTTQAVLDAIAAKKYEVGWADRGQDVPAGNWRTYVSSGDFYLPLPSQAANYYPSIGNKNLDLVFRMKDCPSSMKRIPADNPRLPRVYSTRFSNNDCFTYKNKMSIWRDYDGVFCYPLTIKYYRGNDATAPLDQTVIVETIDDATQEDAILRYGQNYYVQVEDGSGLYTQNYGVINNTPNILGYTDNCGQLRLTGNTDRYSACFPLIAEWRDNTTGTILHTDNNVTSTSITLADPVPYNHNYTLTLKQQDGTVVNTSSVAPTWSPIRWNGPIKSCGGWKAYRGFQNVGASCFPLRLEWVNKATNQVVEERTYNAAVNYYSPVLEYGVEYEVRLKTMDGQVLYTYVDQSTGNANQRINVQPYDITNANYTDKKDYGSLRMYIDNTWVEHWEKVKGEILDPEGRVIASQDYTNREGLHNPNQTPNQSWVDFTNMYVTGYLKPGTYTVKLYCGGEVIDTYQYQHTGFWNTKDLAYTYRRTCAGIYIKPEGLVTWQGQDRPNDTYFQLIAGPALNFDKTVIRRGQELLVGTPGRYLVAVKVANYSNTLNIDTIVVNVSSNPIVLSSSHTLAYACSDNVNDTGHIFVKALGGVAPYTYELWTHDNSSKINVQPVIEGDDVAHWEYGHVGDVYTIHVLDACGTNFEQKLTIADLSRINIASTPDKLTCVGEELVLRSLPLDNYKWYNPQGQMFSTEQNPRFRHATRNMSGRYKVVATPRGCGNRGIEGYVDVLVEPCWAPVNPNLMHKVGSLKQAVED